MAKRKDGIDWTGIIAGTLIFCLMAVWLCPGNLPRQISRDEAILIYERVGLDGLNAVNRSSQRLFDSIIDDQLKRDLIEAMKPSEIDQKLIDKDGLARKGYLYFRERIPVGLDLIYWLIRRVMLLWETVSIWGIFAVMAVMHGYWEREIKKTDFSHTSPVKNAWARMIFKNSLLILLLLAVLPLALDPLMIAGLAAAGMFGAAWAMSNVQKQI